VISYAYFHFVFQNREKRLKIYFFPTWWYKYLLFNCKIYETQVREKDLGP
jgi:hypothetical protein